MRCHLGPSTLNVYFFEPIHHVQSALEVYVDSYGPPVNDSM
jgi:hypothetical protein